MFNVNLNLLLHLKNKKKNLKPLCRSIISWNEKSFIMLWTFTFMITRFINFDIFVLYSRNGKFTIGGGQCLSFISLGRNMQFFSITLFVSLKNMYLVIFKQKQPYITSTTIFSKQNIIFYCYFRDELIVDCLFQRCVDLPYN